MPSPGKLTRKKTDNHAMRPTLPPGKQSNEPADLARGREQEGYMADAALPTVLFVATRLSKPVMPERQAGVAAADVPEVLAGFHRPRLIRLQCYEALHVNPAVYA